MTVGGTELDRTDKLKDMLTNIIRTNLLTSDFSRGNLKSILIFSNYISNKMQLHTVYLHLEIVTGGISTHHQENTQLYLQYTVPVKPLLLPIPIYIQQDATLHILSTSGKLPYIFRVVSPPIIRSTHNCIYSIRYLSNRYCYLPLLWKIWNNSSTIGRSNGLVGTVYCKYSCVCS